MQDLSLVVMAAGMGSRFGGLKQITPVDDAGHMIIDFSLYDAYRAGFRKVIFVIKHAIEEEFKARIGKRMERYFDVTYVYQELDKIPEGYTIPEGRVKPWGTGHAIACLAGVTDAPFAVINSDDFYGAEAYRVVYDFLQQDLPANCYAMVSFPLRNTLSENGSVSRGVCSVEGNLLQDVTERTKIVRRGNDAAFTEDGETWTDLSGDTPVSMNFWGFRRGILDRLCADFPAFLDAELPNNPLKCEFALPTVANRQVQEKSASVRVLQTGDRWFGVTYPEDLPGVKEAIRALKEQGAYPEKLWD
ncbi:MAG: nucleotidyltransferase [Oscillospiraceae bacterium]|nr:nucleotidyltransferase [Oscillospiraceae bacterium]